MCGEIISNKSVKTRKPHKCWGCAEQKPAGTEMEVIVSKDMGELISVYWCSECILKSGFENDTEVDVAGKL